MKKISLIIGIIFIGMLLNSCGEKESVPVVSQVTLESTKAPTATPLCDLSKPEEVFKKYFESLVKRDFKLYCIITQSENNKKNEEKFNNYITQWGFETFKLNDLKVYQHESSQGLLITGIDELEYIKKLKNDKAIIKHLACNKSILDGTPTFILSYSEERNCYYCRGFETIELCMYERHKNPNYTEKYIQMNIDFSK